MIKETNPFFYTMRVYNSDFSIICFNKSCEERMRIAILLNYYRVNNSISTYYIIYK